MTKNEIKAKLRAAMDNNPWRDDIKSVALFGSYVSDEARDQSDVDVLIEFLPSAHVGFFKYVRIQRYFASILGKAVDLVTPQTLHWYIKDAILKQAEIVYER